MPNPAGNLAGAGLGRISEKWADFRFAGARAEIRYNSIYFMTDCSVFTAGTWTPSGEWMSAWSF